MFEQDVLALLVNIAVGAMSFLYAEKFLRLKDTSECFFRFAERRRALVAWALLYAAAQTVVAAVRDPYYPYNNLVNIVPYAVTLFILQKIFFEKSLAKQFFVILSFMAGWEILRFAVSPLAHLLYAAWNALLFWLVNQEFFLASAGIETLIAALNFANGAISLLVIFFCRLVQIVILAVYLRFIGKRIAWRDYEPSRYESLFLVLPCAAVLLTVVTVTLMAVSADNGAITLIYDRVPTTTLLLPLISLILLGVVMSSVVLFQNLLRYREEEQKRILLEKSVTDVHREIKELSAVYADIRGLRHDLRNHIANIAAYVRKNQNSDDIFHYIDQMTETVEKLDFFYRTGNPVTDIILHRAMLRARKKNIRFDADFHYPAELRIDVYDVAVILNNALQNAFEALAGEKNVAVRSYLRGSLFFIETENDFSGELVFAAESDLPATTKSDKNAHGLGLANIRRCAQKYRGEVDIDATGKKFRLTVMLCGKSE